MERWEVGNMAAMAMHFTSILGVLHCVPNLSSEWGIALPLARTLIRCVAIYDRRTIKRKKSRMVTVAVPRA